VRVGVGPANDEWGEAPVVGSVNLLAAHSRAHAWNVGTVSVSNGQCKHPPPACVFCFTPPPPHARACVVRVPRAGSR
jgi:hypothetical protein